MAQRCKPVHFKQKEKRHNPRCPHYTKHQLTRRSGAFDIHFCLGSRFTFTTQFSTARGTRCSVQSPRHYTSHQTNLWLVSFLFDKRKTKACQNHPWVNFSLLLTMSVTVMKVYRSVSQVMLGTFTGGATVPWYNSTLRRTPALASVNWPEVVHALLSYSVQAHTCHQCLTILLYTSCEQSLNSLYYVPMVHVTSQRRLRRTCSMPKSLWRKERQCKL